MTTQNQESSKNTLKNILLITIILPLFIACLVAILLYIEFKRSNQLEHNLLIILIISLSLLLTSFLLAKKTGIKPFKNLKQSLSKLNFSNNLIFTFLIILTLSLALSFNNLISETNKSIDNIEKYKEYTLNQSQNSISENIKTENTQNNNTSSNTQQTTEKEKENIKFSTTEFCKNLITVIFESFLLFLSAYLFFVRDKFENQLNRLDKPQNNNNLNSQN